MLQPDDILWLVRTKSGDILGPFTQDELLEAWRNKIFQNEDEIAQSHGRWFSAQTLVGHEGAEFTRTSTRNQTVTKSMTSDHMHLGNEPTLSRETPKAPTPPRVTRARKPGPQPARPQGSIRAQFFVTTAALIAVVLGWHFYPAWHGDPAKTAAAVAAAGGEEQSPFLRQIAGMIQAGELQVALNKLIEYHEHASSNSGIDYLIPYAALLILTEETPEGGAPARVGAPNRARKLLERVLYSKPNPMLESKAHLWLGYSELQAEEGDFGEAQFLHAIRLNPRDAAARFNLARSYFKRDKFLPALESLQLAEFEMPQLWLVHLLKGRVQARLKQNEAARISFQTALQNSQDRWSTYLYYATFLNNLAGDVEAAQKLLRTMLRRDPLYETYAPPPWGFYQERINYSSYLDAFLNVMNRSSGEEKEVGRLYISYLMTNDDREHRMEQLAQKGSLLARVLALKVLLDRNPSGDEIRAMLARLPNDLDAFGYYAYAQRAEARIRIRQYAEAQTDLSQAVLLSPQSAVIRWLNASLQMKTNHGSDAQRELQNLLTFHPPYFPAIVLLRSSTF